MTGVVNRSLIQLIYDALRETDIEVTWVEPSLVSVARLVGHAQIGGDQPIMIADGTGKQWDVGIACSGRLLLDYRPAAATDEEAFRNALDGHISRLKRFCHRHRGIATGELSRLVICGNGEKPRRAVEILGDSLGVQPEILDVPELSNLYEIEKKDRKSRCVPAVATVLPLLIGVTIPKFPTCLTKSGGHRNCLGLPRLSRRVGRSSPPCVILCISYGLVSSQRRYRAGTVEGRAEIESQIDADRGQVRGTLAKTRVAGIPETD